jgi:hypothetical protein
MAEWELRPLSLGEILDRTFSLYRQNFLLFLGITAIPHLFTLGLNLAQLMLVKAPVLRPHAQQLQVRAPGLGAGLLAFGIGGIIALIVYVMVYLFAQGGTIYAVSDIYLGRPTTVGASLKKMWGQLGNLFGVSVLNGIVVLIGMIFLIVPGIYLMCRLLTCVPAALLEDLGARDSLERSFALTKDNAGRAFAIYLLYFAMLYGIMMLFTIPSAILMAVMVAKDPSMVWVMTALVQVGSFVAQTVVGPFLLIATAVFYYDLRVRKEAFDLQMMMNPEGVTVPARSIVPSMLS